MLTSLAISIAIAGLASANVDNDRIYKHVALFSIDGAHASDIPKWVAKSPHGAIAGLYNTSFYYSGALTSAPSDSFPGTVNLVTGGSPRTTGIWYDDTWDRSFWPPFANLDFNSSLLFSGGIDPDNLSQAMVGGKCIQLYPHARLRVNTIFEVIHAAGKQTAYTDKHPSYDIVRGPSGKGLSIGYFPEIESHDSANLSQTIPYDALHVDAFIKWLNKATPANSEVQESLTEIPTLFGGNFQSVSVGQKEFGYVKGSLDFTPQLASAFQFVDDSLSKVVSEMKDKQIFDDTLVVVCSKHGQAPIDPTLFREIAPSTFATVITANVSWITTDDVALIFLANGADTDAAVDQLNRNRNLLGISDIISGQRLTYLGYGDPAQDPAVPNIIVKPDLGVIYTTSKKKIAEHGGLSNDDRNVACFFSAPDIKFTLYPHQCSTAQVAPTILKALGMDPNALQAVVKEGTNVLSGFSH
ncbi:type I phosphodiesterase/nucleotide pyrophosphatase [Thozetella sp. PMI_491]|nr:type I phosphodiesterase/nucleotide pyrophosphatase [Thozetella sp. PMI_491]